MIGERFWSPACWPRVGCEVDREDESDVDGRGGTFTWGTAWGLRFESDVLRPWLIGGTGEWVLEDRGDPPLAGFRPGGRGSGGSPHWPLVGVSSPVCDGKPGSLGVFCRRFLLPELERIRLDGVVGGKGGCPLGGGGSGGRLCRVGVGVLVGGVPFCLLGNGSGRTDAPDGRPDSCLEVSVRADSDPSRTSRGNPSLPGSETSCNGAGLADSSRRPLVAVFCVGELSLDLGKSSVARERADLEIR